MKNVADIYGLSPMQQLMLLHAKTAGSQHDVLFSQIVYRITGPLDIDSYRRAWQLMVDRHPTLRTIFVWQDGKDPLQVVREEATLPWTEHHWCHLSSAEQERELDKLLAADRELGFDLLHAPLMRVTLIKLADESSWLVWSTHHLIIDRWCIGIIFAELKEAYEAYTNNTQPALPPAPRYRDYIAWLSKQDEMTARDYWQTALREVAASPLPLAAPSGLAEPDLQTVEVAVADELSARLRRFALQNNLTLGVLVTAAWSVVLAAATAADDTLFGITVAGRPADLPAAGSTVGCFINNVPLRVPLRHDTALVPWLQAVQEQQLALQPFEYASPAQIQSWSGLQTGGLLFDSLVILQAPVPYEMPAGLSLEYVRGGLETGYAISLDAEVDSESLELILTYDRRRVPNILAEQLPAAVQRVWQAMTTGDNVPLAALRSAAWVEVPEARTVTVVEEPLLNGTQPHVLPRTVTEQTVAQIWAEVLGLPRVGVEEDFFSLGGDSIRALQLFTRIEERLGKRLPVSLLFRQPTVARMAAALGDDAAEPAADPVLQPINPDGARPPFFYVHGVFGDVLSISNMVPFLGQDQPLYGLQAAGLTPGFEPDRTLEEMAARYVESIRRVQPSGPYYVGGFCFGGVVAYEIARRLEQLGQRTALLAIIEGTAPAEFHNFLPVYHRQRLQVLRESAPQWLQGNKAFGGWRLKEKVAARLGLGADHGPAEDRPRRGTAAFDNLADFNAARPPSQFELRKVNVRAINEYVPPPYGGHVTLFRARYLRIGYALLGELDPQSGWGTLARGGVSIRYVDGTHIGILTPPYASELAAEIGVALREAQERSRQAAAI